MRRAVSQGSTARTAGVCGSERRAEKEGGGEAQAENPPAEQGDGNDRERHCNSQQPPSNHPVPPAQRTIDFKPGTHQSDNNDELSEVLRPLDVFERIERWKRSEWRPRKQYSDRYAANG